MSQKLKRVLTALIVGIGAGVTLTICLMIFISVATPEAVAINPTLFLLLGLTPSILTVAAAALLLVYTGLGSVTVFVRLLKEHVIQEEGSSVFSFYLQLLVVSLFPFALAFNAGVIASSALGGTWAVLATLFSIVLNAILIDRARKFVKDGGLTWVRDVFRRWLRRDQSLGRHPHSA